MGSGVAYAAVYLAPFTAGGWPVDVGDDPSFNASGMTHGVNRLLSWGVCRPDLRNRVKVGDLVVFFAGQAGYPHALRTYRLAGWALVGELVSQIDVWTNERLRDFRRYSNLLIRPSANPGNYEHFETGDAHPDWLWRIARPGRQAPRKERWVVAGISELVDGLIEVDGWRLRPANNYVVFKPEGIGTSILASPPVVASVVANGQVETWLADEMSAALYGLIFEGSTRAGLRTINRHQPHRHVRVVRSAPELAAELDRLRELHGLELR